MTRCLNYSTTREADCVLDEGHGGECRYERRVMMFAATLASNLAVAGALCKAFELGMDLQHVLTNADWLETQRECARERADAYREYFHPGCGRSAP